MLYTLLFCCVRKANLSHPSNLVSRILRVLVSGRRQALAPLLPMATDESLLAHLPQDNVKRGM